MKDPRVAEALAWLKKHSKKSVRDGMARYAIPNDKALGVLMGDIQKLAKLLGRDHALALELWKTDVYEARMLCAYVDEPERVTPAQMDAQARDFDNWADLRHAVLRVVGAHAARVQEDQAVGEPSSDEYVKRASFALLASMALRHKESTDADYLPHAAAHGEGGRDERNFVKKAVSWALRGVGRRSVKLNKASLVLAKKLAASKEPAPRWIGKDAFRELSSAAVQKRLVKPSSK